MLKSFSMITKFHSLATIFIFSILLCSCGGGTQGTATGDNVKSFDGNVFTSAEHQVLPDVSVTIMETGENTVTDGTGHFQIQSSEITGDATFLLESPQFKTTFTVKALDGGQSKVHVDVAVDTVTDTADISELTLKAGMVGACDLYFENRDVIRQAQRVPLNTVCTLSVQIQGDGQPLASFPFALERLSCAPNSSWELVKKSKTQTGENAGNGKISFDYKDSIDFCYYRIITPYKLKGLTPVEYDLITSTAQIIGN